MVADPQQNPDHVAVGDIVRVIDYAEYDNVMRQAGKVVSFRAGRGGYYEDENDLYAIVKFATEAEPDNYEHDRSVKVARLQKETPERIAERRRRHEEELQASLNSPQFNPNGIRIGDEIISRTTDPNHEHSGLHGVVRDIIRRPNGELYAKVDWDERSGGVLGHYVNQPCNITFLYKATPEELEKLRRSRISHNIEQEVQRGREEHLRRSFGNRNDISAADPELVNDTVNNPQCFKPGDFVNVDYRYGRGRSTGGVIVRMERSYWRPDIDAYVKFHRSAEQPRRYSLSRLTRDTSEQAQRMQQRQQQVIQRHQQITQGAGDINIGDTVRVNSGLNRNRIGRVVGFQTGTRNNVRVTCLDNEGVRFTANVSAISKMAA
jgi:hypothetical protein